MSSRIVLARQQPANAALIGPVRPANTIDESPEWTQVSVGAASAAASSSNVQDVATLQRQMATVTLGAALSHVLAAVGKKKKKSGKNGRFKELHIDVGNDERYPFLKRIDSRGQIHRVTSGVASAPLLTSNTAVETFSSQFFTVSGIQHFTSYSTVFDEYMIECVEVLLEPQYTEVVGNITIPVILSCVDIDDANAMTATSDFAAYDTMISSRGTKSHYHRWCPSAAIGAYSGTFTSYANVQGLWIDCASSNVQHFGLKVGMTSTTTQQVLNWQYRLHVLFRSHH